MARILVVDDEDDVRFTLVQALATAGHDCIEASDGELALRRIADSDVELVVTDLLMPNREGLETIMEIRANRADIKIIAISGGGRVRNVEFLEAAKRLGADAYLRKPFRLAELTRAVDDCLASGPG